MSYTLLDEYKQPKPIRLIAGRGSFEQESFTIEIGAPFTPHWWTCDPCAPSAQRYSITYSADSDPDYRPWFGVITSDDKPEDIDAKVAHYSRVLQARQAADKARKELEKLNGY